MSHIHTKLTGQGDLDIFLCFTFKKYKHTISRMQYEKEHLILTAPLRRYPQYAPRYQAY